MHCPFLFEKDKRIVGIDKCQAMELAEMLLRDLLEHHEVRLTETLTDGAQCP